jgi:thiamine kinase-like enzyme
MKKEIKDLISNRIEDLSALTNKVYYGNYKNQEVVLKIYNSNNFIFTNIDNEVNIFNTIKNLPFVPTIIEHKPKEYLITKKIDSQSFNDLDFNKTHFIEIGNKLKVFHALPIDNILKFDVIKKINKYKEGIESIDDKDIINEVTSYLKDFKDYRVCHNDLVRGNLL